jgi:GH24 family phage-related lysozyme (muramidase)
MTGQQKTSGLKKGAIASTLVLALATPFVIKWEGLKTSTYIDVVGIPTVCYGETGAHVRIGQQFTEQQCRDMLDRRLMVFARELDRCVTVPVTPHQGASLLELAYNVGSGPVCRSTLVRQLNEGAPPEQFCGQLSRWVNAGGRPWRGLINRRADSYNMCMGNL